MQFLERIYSLDKIESSDPRFSTARNDIWQHCINNYDWPSKWIFSDDRFKLGVGPDEVILNFLAEMLHPLVRDDVNEVAKLLQLFNEVLASDGYVLFEEDSLSGHPIYGWKSSEGFHKSNASHLIESRPLLTDPRVLQAHLMRIRNGLQSDSAHAISSCKELIESLCKIILNMSEIKYSNADDIQSLYRKVEELLQLNVESVAGNAKASQTSKKIFEP